MSLLIVIHLQVVVANTWFGQSLARLNGTSSCHVHKKRTDIFEDVRPLYVHAQVYAKQFNVSYLFTAFKALYQVRSGQPLLQPQTL
ncbi:hypothetical protein BB14905_23148, partial [Bacillus sp. B14905]